MKKVINGTAYNTETSDIIAKGHLSGKGKWNITIYRTRKGEYFAVRTGINNGHIIPLTYEDINNISQGEKDIVIRKLAPQGRENETFLLNICCPKIQQIEESLKESVIYFRVSGELKKSIERAANKEKSVNIWLQRTVEKALDVPNTIDNKTIEEAIIDLIDPDISDFNDSITINARNSITSLIDWFNYWVSQNRDNLDYTVFNENDVELIRNFAEKIMAAHRKYSWEEDTKPSLKLVSSD